MSREAIEKLLELVSSNLLKESNQLVILNEMISVMTTFNLLEKYRTFIFISLEGIRWTIKQNYSRYTNGMALIYSTTRIYR